MIPIYQEDKQGEKLKFSRRLSEMSVSLYYTAKRDDPISAQEQEACLKALEHY